MMETIYQGIADWSDFHRFVRLSGQPLLKRLDDFPNSVLVSGCQRSGTTMLANVISDTHGVVHYQHRNYRYGPDGELDGALILAGYLEHSTQGRHCFQTTYLNERYMEYFDHCENLKLIWVLRNPSSVVHSMLNNWSMDALDRLFETCGIPVLTGADKWLQQTLGTRRISSLRRACWAYLGKTSQALELRQRLGPERFMVIDYDDLVVRKDTILPAIFRFFDLPYSIRSAEIIHARSVANRNQLTHREIATIEKLCGPMYCRARELLQV